MVEKTMDVSNYDRQELHSLFEALEKASHHASNLYPSNNPQTSNFAQKLADAIATIKADIQVYAPAVVSSENS